MIITDNSPCRGVSVPVFVVVGFFFWDPLNPRVRRVQAREKTRRNAPAGPVLMDVNHRVFGRIAARLYAYTG